MIQWLYENIYTAVGEMFSDINNLGIEIFDLSWVQAMVRLFTLLGWTLFVVGVVVAVFDLGIECQTGRANIKGTALNVLKGFFAASLVGVLPVQLYKLCCSLQGVFTGDLAGIFAAEQTSSIGEFAANVLSVAFGAEDHLHPAGLFLLRHQDLFCQHQARRYPAGTDLGGKSVYVLRTQRVHGRLLPVVQADHCHLPDSIYADNPAGLLTFGEHMLLGLGIMLAANEVPRIAQQFGLDSSVRVNVSSVIHSTSSAVNLARTVFKPRAV